MPVPTVEDTAVSALERLADTLPAADYALVLTVYSDAPPCLSVVPRGHPARAAGVVVTGSPGHAEYVAHTGGGALPLGAVTDPGTAAAALTWTLGGLR